MRLNKTRANPLETDFSFSRLAMHRSRHDIRRKGASALLVVFLIGGLLAPVVHRAHHSQTWGTQHVDASETCDHTQHSDGFETTVPDLLDDDCLLCIRQLHFGEPQTSPDAYHDFSGYLSSQRLAPDTPHISYLSIRGPPRFA